MISVQQAQALVETNAGKAPTVPMPLADSLGQVLAEDVHADLDSPPFSKALMDGYAVHADDLSSPPSQWDVAYELLAGTAPAGPVVAGSVVRIMTGAPIPEGTAAVIPVERSEPTESGKVHLKTAGVRPGQNIMPRGREMQAGQRVLTAGQILGPAEIGVLASVGCDSPTVAAPACIAILSTGDEIVSPGQKPGAGQIRNSNGAMLLALAKQAGATVVNLGIARDNFDELLTNVKLGLASDIFILSGGVSAGVADLVPSVLRQLDVDTVFHHVNLKPGKPTFFGKRANSLVFGLPGNPVAVFCCFHLFVRRALDTRAGRRLPSLRRKQARLSVAIQNEITRETYHPARVCEVENSREVTPVDWFGSPDLLALTTANALLILPVSQSPPQKGDLVDVLLLESP